MMYDRTRLTLGELLTSEDTTIKRNAMSILKMLSGCDHKPENGICIYCFKPSQQRNCLQCGEPLQNNRCKNPDCELSAIL